MGDHKPRTPLTSLGLKMRFLLQGDDGSEKEIPHYDEDAGRYSWEDILIIYNPPGSKDTMVIYKDRGSGKQLVWCSCSREAVA